MRLSFFSVRRILERILEEDIGYGDITTLSVVPKGKRGKFVVRAKEDLVVCGVEIASWIFRLLDEDITCNFLAYDGEHVKAGRVIMEVEGPVDSILMCERTVLNMMQRLSGVSSLTRYVVEVIKDLNVTLVDTRKTTPGMRVFEKYAVTVGCGRNHRIGLFDGVLIKDNHIAAVGSIKEAVRKAKEKVPITVKIEVEVKSIEELKEAIEAECDIILLDNMSIEELREAVRIAKGKVLLEASGGITPDNVRIVAETGVDYISAGFITHHAVWKDINMKYL